MDHNYYLQQYEWFANSGEPYWALPDAEGCIDFRSNTQAAIAGGIPEGYAFVSYANPITDPSAVSLGTDLEETISNATKALIRTTLGITGQITSTALLDILNELFASHSDPTGVNRFKPNMPNHTGLLELYLGGHSRISSERMVPGVHPAWNNIKSVYQENYRKIRLQAIDIKSPMPENQHKKYLDYIQEKYRVSYKDFIPVDLPDEGTTPHDTAVIDKFNRPNEDLQVSPNWALLGSTITEVFGNEIRVKTVGGTSLYQFQTALSTDDHFSQIDVVAITGTPSLGTNSVVTLTRMDAVGGFNTYQFDLHRNTSGIENRRIIKKVLGVTTVLSTATTTFSLPDTIRGESNGSTQEIFENGVPKESATDTSLTGTLFIGVFLFRQTATISDIVADNWSGGDISFVPNAPVITKVIAGNTQVTVSVTGDAGKTHEVFFFTPGSTVPVSGGTRVGDGDIIITGLTNDVTIQAKALTQSVSGTLFGPPSNTVFATPRVTAATPSRPIAAVYSKTFTELTGSAGLGAWIASVNALETTAGHVFLGYDPNKIKDVITKGPAVFVHLGRFETTDSISEKAFVGEVDVKVTFVWAINQHTQETLVDEVNRLEAILLEFSKLGLNPGGTSFPGNLKRMSSPTLIMIESEKPVIRQAEVTFTFAFPMEN